jgi:methyl-accepting chemotaxis protein
MMETIRELIDETARISAAATEGKLDVRGDADRFHGEYTNIISGINRTLDAVSAPVRELRNIMTRMSNGEVHISMTGSTKANMRY